MVPLVDFSDMSNAIRAALDSCGYVTSDNGRPSTPKLLGKICLGKIYFTTLGLKLDCSSDPFGRCSVRCTEIRPLACMA